MSNQALSLDEERQRRSRVECSAQRGAAIKATVSAILAVAAVIAVCVAATNQSTELKEKDVGSMKTINSILKHLDKLSQSAVAGEEKDKRAANKVKEMNDSEAAVDAPVAVKHGISHVSHALKEAEDAEKSFKTSDDSLPHHAHGNRKATIAAKMKALQEQILSDFKKVTGFGKKAGYIPPVKMPHV